MRVGASLMIFLAFFLSAAWPDEGHHHKLTEEEIGSVHFPMTCGKDVETGFQIGVALLHSFQYEQARGVFDEIARHDPTCAMAEWGVAMSHYHGLWDNGDMAAGRKALQRAQAIGEENAKTTRREKAYIEALAEIYREDENNAYAHAQAFEQKMAGVEAAYPEDSEAAIFHALSLVITAPKTDKTFANQRKCGEILEPIFARLPQHPGVAHYLIHCYDNPLLAEKGLAAARAYAKIAPASAHANHMPSHIFTRVGSWDESIASNLKSAELAAAAERSSVNGEARDQRLHAMDYLEYAYLQSGRVQQARAVVDQMNALPPVAGLTLTGDYARGAIPARYAIETRNWRQAGALRAMTEGVPWAQALTWVAIGVGSARSKHPDRAAQAEQALASLRDATAKGNNTYWANQVEVERLEVAAWISHANDQSSDAILTMKAAAELEESMDKHAVTPGAVTPAREMLAELLVLAKHPQDALAEFELVLKVAPNRFNALFGAASAAEAAGSTQVATRYFQKLLQVGVGEERPELVTARKKVAVSARN
jgi:tetratricopeptide (TPR) repeat protein